MSEHLREQWRKTAASDIQGYLRTVADMQKQMRQQINPDWKFHSIEELVLAYGREYTPGPLADDLCQGEMGLCYSNAARAAMDTGYTYVEGYGMAFFPTGHAWVTADGRTAMDPTWTEGKGYFGIPLTTSFLTSWISRTGKWGVFFADIPDQALLDLLKDGLPPGAVA